VNWIVASGIELADYHDVDRDVGMLVSG